MLSKSVLRREQKIVGIAACQAALKVRFDDAIRLYINEQNLDGFRTHLHLLAKAKKAYHIVSNNDLVKITEGSTHHEGVCLIIKAKPSISLTQFLKDLDNRKKSDPLRILYLQGVQNPHNLGAICRVAAHFGVHAMIVEGDTALSSILLSASFYRVAEGGAEFVETFAISADSSGAEQNERLSARNVWKALKGAGLNFIGTSSHCADSLYTLEIPKQVVIVLGSESQGISQQLLRQCDKTVNIPGTGSVESINVACAASIILAEHWRQH